MRSPIAIVSRPCSLGVCRVSAGQCGSRVWLCCPGTLLVRLRNGVCSRQRRLRRRQRRPPLVAFASCPSCCPHRDSEVASWCVPRADRVFAQVPGKGGGTRGDAMLGDACVMRVRMFQIMSHAQPGLRCVHGADRCDDRKVQGRSSVARLHCVPSGVCPSCTRVGVMWPTCRTTMWACSVSNLGRVVLVPL